MLPLQTIPRRFVVVYRTQFFTRLEHDEFVSLNSPTGFPTVSQQNTDPFSRVVSECYGQIYGKGPWTINLNFIRLLRVVITPSVTSESTGR